MHNSFKKLWTLSTEKDLDNNKVKEIIPTEWQLILMSDGSFTQHLNSLTGKIINLNIVNNFVYKHYNVKHIVREVWLKDHEYNKLTFAKSIWPLCTYKTLYTSILRSKPIGQSLIESKIDMYKDIHEIYYGYCKYLAQTLKITEPTWGRKYTIYSQNKPLATIHEIFSPRIINFLKNNQL